MSLLNLQANLCILFRELVSYHNRHPSSTGGRDYRHGNHCFSHPHFKTLCIINTPFLNCGSKAQSGESDGGCWLDSILESILAFLSGMKFFWVFADSAANVSNFSISSFSSVVGKKYCVNFHSTHNETSDKGHPTKDKLLYSVQNNLRKSTTSLQHLYKGHNAGCQACPLLGGSTVISPHGIISSHMRHTPHYNGTSRLYT